MTEILVNMRHGSRWVDVPDKDPLIYPNSGKPWAVDDDIVLARLAPRYDLYSISWALGRTYHSVDHRCRQLGVSYRKPSVPLPDTLGRVA